MFSSEQEKPVKYGELIVLGCNGSLPGGDRGRRRSCFSLFKRQTANGVKPSITHTCSTQAAKVISNNIQHSVSYTLSWDETVVVEYTDDNETDMFQIGRSIESPIDFVVMNTVGGGSSPMKPQQSTISRFACRIVCDRTPPYTARLFAAGFDCSRNIFLGEKAAKWQMFGGQMDGLTTNGVLLMQPACGTKPAVWREISVCGNVFTLRDPTSPQNRGSQVKDECPVLLDGSLIDLCGVTLMWRSVDGLSRSPTAGHLEALRLRLNAARPQCPVLLSTLAFPSLDGPRARRPWAYLACGHVHGFHQWQGRGVAYKHHTWAETEKREPEREEGRKRETEGEKEGGAIPDEREEKRDKREKVQREETKEGGERDTERQLEERENGHNEQGERDRERQLEERENGHNEQGERDRGTMKREGGRDRQMEKERQAERIEEVMEAVKGERECPLCRTRGPYVPLTLGRVSGVYVDAESPSHAFIPCGHVCSARTAEHWSRTPLKRGSSSFHPACPFCLKQLKPGRPTVRLIFQGPLD